ncbi:hypothetical protein EPA93_07720 [Ktedonosporobacter rubrisoli]|uniref:HlyD family efflux transporter periplasmic adaptor subunit n=1 Tax=Ktedonosporobacter rubrisoli TaxID=2509675 RepID=A0A4P6JLN0_KTERU|nr:hypothetical protein [Ktedonosporobacter rubrisoli]QBD75902.1 hypothetical protein EPA93_07720 [Ktedonosporobacter rubrisoli]
MLNPRRRQIFRENALRYYAQRREQDVLPQLVSPFIFAFFWSLGIFVLLIGLLLWTLDIPAYASAQGVVLQPAKIATNSEAEAVIFFPASTAHLHPGMRVQIQLGASGPRVTSKIETVTPGAISPQDAQQRFALGSSAAQVITQPAIAVTTRLGPAVSVRTYAGSIVKAQVQVGTQQVLSFLQ